MSIYGSYLTASAFIYIDKSHVQTFPIQCCKTTATASNLQLLAARSPLSCWMPWHLLWPLDVLPGTTFGGPLALLGSVVGCWGACCQELALGLLLSTAKEHELSVVVTLMVITPPSMSNITSQTVVFYYPVECVIVVIISSSYIKALDLWYRNILSNQLV